MAGVALGVWSGTTIDGAFRTWSLSPASDGTVTAGVLAGDLIGHYYPEINMWSLDQGNTMSLLPTTVPGLNPNDLTLSGAMISGTLAGGFTGVQGSVISGAATPDSVIYLFLTSGGTVRVPVGFYDLKVTSGAYSGRPTGAGSSQWTAQIGGATFGFAPTDSGYWIAGIGTVAQPATWSGTGELIGGVGGWGLTGTRWVSLEGEFRGIGEDGATPGSGTWTGGIVGSWQEKTLTFAGSELTDKLTYYSSSPTPSLVEGGAVNGLFGGYGDIWRDPATTVYFMGNYGLMPGERSYLLYNPEIKTSSSSLGGAFRGYAAALWGGGNINGGTSLIYVVPDANNPSLYQAGYLQGDLTGHYYPNLNNMWEMMGSLTRTSNDLVDPLDSLGPEDFLAFYLDDGSFLPATSKMSGGFSAGGTLSANYVNGTLLGLTGNSGLPWGIWNVGLGGSYSGNTGTQFTARIGSVPVLGAGGFYYNGSSGYMIGSVASNDWGTAFGNNTFTASLNGSFITDDMIGSPNIITDLGPTGMTGSLVGSFANNEWQSVGMGTWSAAPLMFRSDFETVPVNYDPAQGFVDDGIITSAFGGGASLFYDGSVVSPIKTGIPMTMIGTYEVGANVANRVWYGTNLVQSFNPKTGLPLTYETSPKAPGAYAGYFVGTAVSDVVNKRDNMEGLFAGISIGPNGQAGLITGGASGYGYPSRGTANPNINMLQMTGTVNRVDMQATQVAPGSLIGYIGYRGFPVDGNTSADTRFIVNGADKYDPSLVYAGDYNFLTDPSSGPTPWGFQQYYVGRTLTGLENPGDNWTATIAYTGPDRVIGQELWGTQWSNGSIRATSNGYGASTADAPMTWVSVGEVRGTFNPTDLNVQLVSVGPYIETGKFLQMAADASANGGQAKLRALNIPCVEVGVANISGSATSGANMLDIAMNQTKFFAYQGAEAPKIWANGSVTGSYLGDPTKISTGVALKVANTTIANFQAQQWQSTPGGKWMGTVTGNNTSFQLTAPAIAGNTYTGTVNNINGAAAGTVTTIPVGATPGAFTGTAAGTAR